MDCPRCQKALEEHTIGDVPMQTCCACDGCWFDGGDLQRAIELRQDVYEHHEIKKMEDAHKDAIAHPHEAQKALVCPRCGAVMNTINYAYSSGILVDRCAACEGMWLDQGELQAIEELVHKWESKLTEEEMHWGPVLQKTKLEMMSRMGPPDSSAGRPRSLLGGLVASVLFRWR